MKTVEIQIIFKLGYKKDFRFVGLTVLDIVWSNNWKLD